MPGNQSKVYPPPPPSIHRQLTHKHFKWYYSYKTEGIRDIDIVMSYNVRPLLHVDPYPLYRKRNSETVFALVILDIHLYIKL